MTIKNLVDVEVINEEVLIHGTARLMSDGNYYLDARVGGDVILNGVKYEIDQVVEVKLSVNKEAMEVAESGILDRGQKIEKVFRLKAVEQRVQSDEKPCPLNHRELIDRGVDVCPECNEDTASRR